MAEDVGQAYVGIVPSLRGFSARLKAELAAELRAVDTPVAQAGKRAGGHFGDSMREGIRTRLSGIAAMLKTGLVVGAAAAVAGLGALTAFGLKSAAALEQTTIGIEALTGSAQEAQTFLVQLQQFAAKTPFEFQGVADASRRILAFGNAVGITREEVIPTLGVIGDLVSVLGGSQESIDSVVRALGQISSKGKVSQEELLQLAEALPGFNANAAIASALGLSVGESMQAITRGEVDATTGINALLAGMAQFPGAAGAMEKQSQTLLGVFSTFKDTVGIALTNAFQPVIPAIKDSLAQLTPILGQAVDQLAPSLGGILSALLPILGQVVTALVPVLTPILDAIAATLPTLAGALGPLGEVIGGIVTALAPILPVLGEVAAAIVAALLPAIEALTPAIGFLAPLFIILGRLVASVFEALGPVIGELIETVVRALLPALGKLLPVFGEIVDAVLPILPAILELVPPLLDLVLALVPLIDSFTAFTPLLLAVLPPLAQLTALVINFLAQKAIIPLIEQLTGAVRELTAPLQGAAEWIGKVSDWLKGIDWAATGEAISTAFKDAWSTVSGFFGDVLQWFQDLPTKIKEKLIGAKDWLKDTGTDMIQGLIDGAGDLLSKIGQFLLDKLPGWLVDPFKRALGIHSPSTVFAEIGEDTVAGYVQGLEDSARSVSGAMAGLVAPAATATAGAPLAPVRQAVNVDSSDPLIAMAIRQIREHVLARFGGSVDIALGSAGGF